MNFFLAPEVPHSCYSTGPWGKHKLWSAASLECSDSMLPCFQAWKRARLCGNMLAACVSQVPHSCKEALCVCVYIHVYTYVYMYVYIWLTFTPTSTILTELRFICNAIISKHLLGQLITHRGKSWHAEAQGTLKYECHATTPQNMQVLPSHPNAQTPNHSPSQTAAQQQFCGSWCAPELQASEINDLSA